MLRCKHVADALAKHHYWELPWVKRIGLKLHVYLCVFCGRFHRQAMGMQDCAHLYHQHEEADDPTLRLPMPPEAKERIKEALKQSKPAGPAPE